MDAMYRNYEKFSKDEKKRKEYQKYTHAKFKEKTFSNYEHLTLARAARRPKAKAFIEHILQEPLYFHGDKCYGDDEALLGGIGKIGQEVVTFLAIDKGEDLLEAQRKHFGMVTPAGFQKAMRLMKQAEKFHRPVITFIDTPGAYPGADAEEQGQAFAIAKSIATMCGLQVPIVTTIIGEGYSGGALALGVCDRMLMLEHAIYSILSPEGFSSILWKSGKRVEEAAQLLRFSAKDMLEFGICHEVISERGDILFEDFSPVFEEVKEKILQYISELKALSTAELLTQRKERWLWD